MNRTWPPVLLLALALAGCSSTSDAPPPVAAPAGPPPVTGWLAGAGGEQLEPDDRQKAFEAQIAAAETGRRASWRSLRGHFGFVEPGPETASCRPFSHTLYVDGVARRGSGTACRTATGAWQVS